MAVFIGREKEVQALKNLLNRNVANLVVLKGRRRIGKSSLIAFFAQNEVFYHFTGLPPTPSTTKQSQLDEFSRQLSIQTGLPEVKSDDWSKLFLLLAEKLKKGRIIVLFDEIAWMGSKDPDFLGKLKNVWDDHFKQNNKLMLILCGSVSSWIEKNIISSTGFLGRPSLFMTLEELPLHDCNLFWKNQNHLSPFEKLKILCVIGGVPRYLELIDPSRTAEENIKQLCFNKNGPLVDEFERIFSDIFSTRAPEYKKIVEILVLAPATADEIANRLKLTRTGVFDDYLEDLLLGGFLARDYTWHLKDGRISKLSKFRLKDNYVRFYLKYILPNKPRIAKDYFSDKTVLSFPGWDTIMGLQFENLVLNNTRSIMKLIGIKPEEVVFDNPFFQRPTTRQSGCQIDYMIQTRHDTLFVCEIKFTRYPIKPEIIQQMQKKIELIKVPRHISRRAVLIHVNGVSDEVVERQYFSHIIDFSETLTTKFT